ncbi:unnamed protein product [Ambrosiozyma monospora]|uniref:Unnamed protein product n=1 Tax=Ambrosiozyma monospora TaxID=43982 RepID=A0ACB5SVT4_AMBMO|nr:unnamed protein product [Ambrosiozyma monospora]
MTSNIGQDIMLSDDKNKTKKVLEVMKGYYAPEFINRIDEVVVFNKLSKKALRNIVDLRIDELQDRLLDRRIEIELSEAAKDWLTDNGYEPQYGARPLNRLIKRRILNPMSIMMLKGEIKSGMTVSIDVGEKGELIIVPKTTAAEAEETEKDGGEELDSKKNDASNGASNDSSSN